MINEMSLSMSKFDYFCLAEISGKDCICPEEDIWNIESIFTLIWVQGWLEEYSVMNKCKGQQMVKRKHTHMFTFLFA